MSDAQAAPTEPPIIRVIAMPADTNPYGDIFGGWLMSWMDSAAGSVASRYTRGRAVTVAMEGMQFLHPVSVGDEVSFYARIAKVGRTSLQIEIQAWRRMRFGEEMQQVTKAVFTFVALGEDRQPRVIERPAD